MLPEILTLDSLRAAYAAGTSPRDVVDEVLRRRAAWPDGAVFITPAPEAALRAWWAARS